MRLQLKKLLWIYTTEINAEFNPLLEAEYYNHVGYDNLAGSEKVSLLEGVLQKPGYATAANHSADGFFPVNKGSLYTFLLPKPLSRFVNPPPLLL